MIQEIVEETVEEAPMLTQDTEEAPSVAVEKIEEKKPEKKIEEKPKVDSRAIYAGRKTDATYKGTQGNSQSSGNQGSLSGDVDATNYGLGGGTGNKPGFYLEGRNAVSLPAPNIDSQKEGKVVVQIKVDREGNIISATPGVKGSTTLDAYLLSMAKKAALRSKFDGNPNAPFYQTGTITYIFRVK